MPPAEVDALQAVRGVAAQGRFQMNATVAERRVDVELDVAPGETLAVLGPNGAGKSTVLSLAAGLLQPDRGWVTLDGVVLADPSTWVPPHQRPVALLAQQALLFPHLSVRENVAFGPRSRGCSRSEARQLATHWLDQVDAADLAHRRPSSLSGGQQQRVAVARALATDPALLLLDEPLAALDVASAPALRGLLRRVLSGRRFSTVLVTHDVLDALTLADRAAVLDGGRVVESGPVREVLSAPRSAFAARIAGVNLLTGTATAGGLDGDDGRSIVGRAGPDTDVGAPAVAVFRPAAVAVHTTPPAGSPRNALSVVVGELEPRGDLVRVHATDGLSADVTLAAIAELDLQPGQPAWFAVKATEVTIHPAAGRRQRSGS